MGIVSTPDTPDNDSDDSEDATKISVAGANCSWCLNDALEQVRGIEGVTSVTSSMAEECIYVVHPDVETSVVLDMLRANLHGASSDPESSMLPVDPQPTITRCRHGLEHHQVTPRIVDQNRGLMETVTDAMNRLREAGYGADFSADGDGNLVCGSCGGRSRPEDMVVHETVRFEGESNPDDEAILFALECACGCLGQYSAAFGPDTPREDAVALRRLSRRRPTGGDPPTPAV